MELLIFHIYNNICLYGAGEEARTLDLNLGKVALYQLSYSRIGASISTTPLPTSAFYGAGEEARTLDLNLGKVALYQLSYSRIGASVSTTPFTTISILEREKRLELSTSTLARLRSTN
jgi:hypothetical protein